MTKALVLSCGHRSRMARAPVVVEPKAVPDPLTAAPAETTDEEVANGATEDRSPEEDVAGIPVFIFFPILRNEERILQEVVQNVVV